VPGDFLDRVRAMSDVPVAARGEAIVRTRLAAWADAGLARIMRTSLLIAAHEPVAMAKVRAVFADEQIVRSVGATIQRYLDAPL
jgi:hypothetical protein